MRAKGSCSKRSPPLYPRLTLAWGFAECGNAYGSLVALYKFSRMVTEQKSPPFYLSCTLRLYPLFRRSAEAQQPTHYRPSSTRKAVRLLHDDCHPERSRFSGVAKSLP